MSKKNIIDLKENSHITVLNTIRINTSISAADIARSTGYQPSTISNNIKILKQKNLIVNAVNEIPKSIGKPPTLLTLNHNLGVIIGLECILNEFRLSVLDFSGNAIKSSAKKFERILTGDELLDEIKNFLDPVVKDFINNNMNILGLGLALPGLVDNEEGVLIYSKTFKLYKDNFQIKLEEHFNFPVQIENDANCGALCAIWFDEKNDVLQNIIFTTINDVTKGIGTGIIINNKLYKGRNFAGEVLVDLPDFEQRIESLKQEIPNYNDFWKDVKCYDCISFTQLVEMAQKNDEIALTFVKEYGEIVAEEIVKLIGFFDPDNIYLGGEVPSREFLNQNYILPSIAGTLRKAFSENYIIPKISVSKYGIFAVSTGAAALIFRNIFEF